MKRLLVFTIFFAACNACGAPQSEQLTTKLGQAIEVEAPGGEHPAFDHSKYDALLKKYVNMESGRVDYKGLASKRAVLDAYTKSIADADLSRLTRQTKFALLLNAYNAYTLTLILDNYPGVKSIKDLSDPWGAKKYVVAGETVSLNNIEHNLLRPIFKDPRIHFAVNCASIGCPPLANFAFSTANGKFEQQLDTVTWGALKNPRYATVKGDTLELTSIMKWYGDDFSKVEWKPRAESIAEFAATYGGDDVKALVAGKGGATTVTFGDYNWNLNDIDR